MQSPLGVVKDEGPVASAAVGFVFVFAGVGCGVYFVAVCVEIAAGVGCSVHFVAVCVEIAEIDVECWIFVVAFV